MSNLARDPKQIGNIIRNARKRLKLTQAELANRTGVRQATISEIETGNSSARVASLLPVLAALDLEFRIAPRSRIWDMDQEDSA